MLRFASLKNESSNGKDTRLDIKNYEHEKHRGKIFCLEGHPLLAKRGDKIQHHYAHLPGFGINCSSSEGKTSWHLWWQSRIKPWQLEFRFQKEFLKIADSVNIQNGKLMVIEFQNSVMKKEEIALRERFYTRRDLLSEFGHPDVESELVWIFNLENSTMEIEHVFGDYVCFRLGGGQKYMFHAKARSYLDFGKCELVEFLGIWKMDTETPYVIGKIVGLKELDRMLFKDILVEEGLDEREYRHPLIVSGQVEREKIEGCYNEKEILDKLKEFYFMKAIQKPSFG